LHTFKYACLLASARASRRIRASPWRSRPPRSPRGARLGAGAAHLDLLIVEGMSA
jgi:hypothetical protein